MATNRRKAVRDRKKHREKVEKRVAAALADRLTGRVRTLGIDKADGEDNSRQWAYKFK